MSLSCTTAGAGAGSLGWSEASAALAERTAPGVHAALLDFVKARFAQESAVLTPVFPRLLKRLAERYALVVDVVSPIPPTRRFNGTAGWRSALARAVTLFARGESKGDCLRYALRRR
jgi:hypothetical protein